MQLFIFAYKFQKLIILLTCPWCGIIGMTNILKLCKYNCTENLLSM